MGITATALKFVNTLIVPPLWTGIPFDIFRHPGNKFIIVFMNSENCENRVFQSLGIFYSKKGLEAFCSDCTKEAKAFLKRRNEG